MLLVIAEDKGRFSGCFPVLRVAKGEQPSSSWSGVRRPVFTTQVRRLRYDGTPLVRELHGVETAATLLTTLVEQRGVETAGILVLEAVDADGPVAEYFKSAAEALKLPFYAYRTWTRPIARRPDSETSTSPRIGAYQKNAAKWRRQLSDELDGAVTVVDRSADVSAIDQLIELEAAGYKARSGVAMVDHRGESDWFREMCTQF